MKTIDRRRFLMAGGAAALGLAVGPRFLFRMAEGAEETRRPVLVVVFQRGGMDGLSAVVPYADKHYYDLRKNTAIRPPGKAGANGAVNLDGRFGLHPAMAPLAEDFKAKRLAVVHAVGSPDPTRSHFDAQDYMETGTPGKKGTEDGWLSRYVATHAREGEATFRSMAITGTLPRSMRGNPKALAISGFNSLNVGGGEFLGDAFAGMYGHGDGEVRRSGREAFAAVRRLRRANPAKFTPENGAAYPRGQFGQRMLTIAQLVKAGVGLEVAFLDSGGWDTHLNQGSVNGVLANRLRELGGAMNAFARDLGDRMRDVVLVTMTEFGRTAKENGTNGTDHGHGSVGFVLGGEVKGGKVYGRWPGLSPSQLWQKRDLAVTTDFRNVLTEVLTKHLGAADVTKVFPNHRPKRVGLL